MLCTNIELNVKTKKQFLYTTCSELVFSSNSMNNLSSYCGLTDARMRASEKDLPVPMLFLEDFLELEFDSLLDLLFAAYDEAIDILLSTSGCKCMGTLVISPLSNMAINRS